MNLAQKQHLDRIKNLSVSLIDTKYKRGAKEHKGADPLLAMDEDRLASEIIYELVDALTYVITLREKQMAKKGFKCCVNCGKKFKKKS